MKKSITLALLLIMTSAGLYILHKKTSFKKQKKYTIGVLQTASHPALDAVYKGFSDQLHKHFGDTVEILFQNTQGSVTDAFSVAQRFKANKKINSFFAIATPAAQALAGVEKERPVVLAAVTDPESLGLIHPTTNVTGVRDMIDIPGTITLIKNLVPDAQKIGLLFTTGETNAVLQADVMRKALQENGFEPIDFAIPSEADVPTVIQMASRKTDLILAPTDHTVASTITIIASLALKNKTPLIVSDNMLVPMGALAARGVDYEKSGKQAADIIYDMIQNSTKPYEIGIKQADIQNNVINTNTARILDIHIPESIQKDTIFV